MDYSPAEPCWQNVVVLFVDYKGTTVWLSLCFIPACCCFEYRECKESLSRLDLFKILRARIPECSQRTQILRKIKELFRTRKKYFSFNGYISETTTSLNADDCFT